MTRKQAACESALLTSSSLSDIAKLAGLESLQYQFEGPGADTGAPEKGCSMAPMVKSTSPITAARVNTISLCAHVFSRPKSE